jgi:hypothetical protein
MSFERGITAVFSVDTARFGPYHTRLSGAQIRTVLYLYRKRPYYIRLRPFYYFNTSVSFIIEII